MAEETVIDLSKNKWFYIFIGVVVVGVIGYFAYSSMSSSGSATQLSSNVFLNMGESMGNSSAKVTVVEFADFQCPYCQNWFAVVEPQLVKDYVDTGKVKFVFRNFPFIGQDSVWAAEAAYCALDQNQFWQYHDYLYNHQGQENSGAFSKANLESFAAKMGLNTTQFDSCLESDKYASKVQGDYNAGKNAGVTSTPSFFVNGKIIVGNQPYSQLQSMINSALNT